MPSSFRSAGELSPEMMTYTVVLIREAEQGRDSYIQWLSEAVAGVNEHGTSPSSGVEVGGGALL